MEIIKSYFNYFLILTLFFAVLVSLPGCGKDETTGGLVGAASGAAIGHAVSGRHDKGLGTIVGGLAGALVGKEIGRASDEESAERKQKQERVVQAKREAFNREEMNSLHEENRNLRKNLIKWCESCGTQVEMIGAQRCPDCGGNLIREKFCKECLATFNPRSGYKYCPFCRNKVLLTGR
jgi:hypothetical protein